MRDRLSLRMAYLLILVILIAGTGGMAHADETLKNDVLTAFDQAVREHASFTDLVNRSPESDRWSLYNPTDDYVMLNHSAAMTTLLGRVRALAKAGDEGQVQAYCRTAGYILTDPSPQRRAVAAEFLASFPSPAIETGTIPLLGNLLKDSSTVFPAHQVHIARDKDWVTKFTIARTQMTVQEIARQVLTRICRIHFANYGIFHTWWEANQNYAQRYWYWAMRFRAAGYFRTGGFVICGSGKITTTHNSENEIEATKNQRLLAAMPPLRALKLYLLSSSEIGLWNEVEDAWRSHGLLPPKDLREDQGYYLDISQGPNPDAVTQFIVNSRQQQVLRQLLFGEITWPEIEKTGHAGADALGYALETYALPLLGKEDVIAIENLLASGKGLPARTSVLQSALALRAVELDPARAEEILLNELHRHPGLVPLAAELVRRSGGRYAGEIVASYAAADNDHRRMITEACIARMRTPEGCENAEDCRQLMGKLFSMQPLQVLLDGHNEIKAEDYTRGELTADFANAVDQFPTGYKPRIDYGLIETATRILIKRDIPTQEYPARRHAMIVARDQVIALLREFFASEAY